MYDDINTYVCDYWVVKEIACISFFWMDLRSHASPSRPPRFFRPLSFPPHTQTVGFQ